MDNRASKKQQELYDFVEAFISDYGYGPSYREIMTALNYKSVSTVAVHVNGLIKKGYLKKLDGSARTLAIADKEAEDEELKAHQDWLLSEVLLRVDGLNERSTQKELADKDILIESLRILGLDDAYEKVKSSSEGEE